MAALKMDCDTVMEMSLSIRWNHWSLEITGNWQGRTNHNVQKNYETTVDPDRKENKQNMLP